MAQEQRHTATPIVGLLREYAAGDRTIEDPTSDAADCIEALVDALRPFSEFRIERATEYAEREAPWADDRMLVGHDGVRLTVGMVRAARAALKLAEGK